MKSRSSMMVIIIGIFFIFIGILVIVFNIPYSPLKQQFNNDIEQLIIASTGKNSGVYTVDDFAHLPNALQNYIVKCGYIGQPKANYLKMVYKDVDFKQSSKRSLKITYTHYDFADEPCRLAMIDTSMFGIPFEGYDYYLENKASMKGVIAKYITLFDQKGNDMNKAALITYLGESIFLPSALLKGNIIFEEIDSYQLKATIKYNDIIATGVFIFNSDYEMIEFYSEERACVKEDGNVEYIPWSAVCSDYLINDIGIKYPTYFKAIWHYPDDDVIYFDGKVNVIEVN